ncbi:putative bifunctional diguanylate cyclase/phosphodiesterase [Tissierella pigra]|uniref:EAL domain-containing protein n=2 Tax=Tissierella pigra TaxID=2607614 RepID=A0A6N7XN25_9FIRM|nr:EAL domain-containing protein [Tissierella pigra]MSU03491.1 EAL domain-containing protein [Tissierella pigra]
MVTTYGGKTITVKIGIVEIDESYSRIDDIIKDAEIALNNISEKENKKYCFFDETMREDLILNETIEKELRKVIYDNNSEEFYLEYQPQINLKTDYIVGFEALARWKNKELGIISPIKFIDVAEKQQLIVPLGRLILIKACNFIKTLENEGHKGIKVAVNISLIQLLQYDFITDVIEIIEKARIRPENLELEITETVLADNYEIINEKLSKLRKEGISISLDDFGTGHSSLARLKKINIDTIKIDKLFIDNLLNKDQEKVLTSSIISLVHKIGLMVIAEGVETEAQKQYLIKNNCDIMQGYLFSKPVSMENAIKLLSKTNGIELISEITI